MPPSSTTPPQVTIGLPVYNGEALLRHALDSLLAQDHPAFIIEISDNGSTDTTEQICREYAERDERIRYDRNEVNRGACWNFNRVRELADSEYFMWAAHDDLWHPTFISKCFAALEADPSAVICHSEAQNMTYEGQPVGHPYIDFVNLEATRRGRWRRSHSFWQLHAAIYGLMRTAIAKKVRGPLPMISCDLIFVAEMSLYGKIIQLPEVLQWNRMPAEQSGRYESNAAMLEYLDPNKKAGAAFHHLKVCREAAKGIDHAGIRGREKAELVADLASTYFSSHFMIDVKDLLRSVIKNS